MLLERFLRPHFVRSRDLVRPTTGEKLRRRASHSLPVTSCDSAALGQHSQATNKRMIGAGVNGWGYLMTHGLSCTIRCTAVEFDFQFGRNGTIISYARACQ